MSKEQKGGEEPRRWVYATENLVLYSADGLPFRLIAGWAWLADDPLVKLHPSNFSAEPPERYRGRSVADPAEIASYLHEERPRVEQATHAPGETRE